MTEAETPAREVLRLLLEADSYPFLGNDDWLVVRPLCALDST